MSEDHSGQSNRFEEQLARLKAMQDDPNSDFNVRRREVRAELEAMPEQHWRDLQHHMATDKRQRHACEKCLTIGYSCAMQACAFHAAIEGRGPIHTDEIPKFLAQYGEFHELYDRAGYFRHCDACKELGPITFEWIARVPFAAFRQFQIDNGYSAYVIDDMKKLLPPEGGLEFL